MRNPRGTPTSELAGPDSDPAETQINDMHLEFKWKTNETGFRRDSGSRRSCKTL